MGEYSQKTSDQHGSSACIETHHLLQPLLIRPTLVISLQSNILMQLQPGFLEITNTLKSWSCTSRFITNPFDYEYTDLTSLSTGLSASSKDNVNCDNVDGDKAVGYEIQNKCVA